MSLPLLEVRRKAIAKENCCEEAILCLDLNRFLRYIFHVLPPFIIMDHNIDLKLLPQTLFIGTEEKDADDAPFDPLFQDKLFLNTLLNFQHEFTSM